MDDNVRRRIRKIKLGLTSDGTITTGGVFTESALAGDSGHDLAKWLASEFNHNFDAYDKAVDSAYLTEHIGGSQYHHLLDQQHDLFGAWRAVRDVSVDDSWLTEITQASEHFARDAMSVSGINPFFSLDPEQFAQLADLAATVGISKPFLADALTLNGPELLGGALALAGSLLLAGKVEPGRVSKFAGGCAASALASANPLLLPIAAGSLIYSICKSEDKRPTLISAGKGGFVSGSVMLVSATIGGPAWLGCAAAMLGAVAINKAIEDPAKTFRRAQEMIAPATEVLRQVSRRFTVLSPGVA
jgi:hypothetical protein